MENEKYIPLSDFCRWYNIEYSFIHLLSESGLLQIITVEEKVCISLEQVPELEKYIRLHYDLEINIEGIEAISHLLNKINELQKENRVLKNNFI